MKKWFLAIAVLLIVALVLLHLLLPATTVVSRSVAMNGNVTGLLRFLDNPSNWRKFAGAGTTDTLTERDPQGPNGYRFFKRETLFQSFALDLKKDADTASGTLYVLTAGFDSLRLDLTTHVTGGADPVSRIRTYFRARRIGEDADALLSGIRNFMGRPANIYGVPIHKQIVDIEFMAATKEQLDQYPSDSLIYTRIKAIQDHLAGVGAKTTGEPIFNISTRDSIHYDLLVSIPVETQIKDAGPFTSKRMLRGGTFLTADVTGGPATVKAAMKQFDLYAVDHYYKNIALPFQIYLTDRRTEPDTSKWVTRIGYPVL